MGFLDKLRDPLGIKKKAKKKLKGTFLGDVMEFEEFQQNRWLDMLKENPEQALLGGLTPVGSKVWGEVTGKDYEPFVNMWGGPTQQAFIEAEAAGIDTSDVQTSHKLAEMVASYYAGGALSGLAGQGAAATGSQAAARAASAFTPRVASAAATMGAGALEEAIAPLELSQPVRGVPGTLRVGNVPGFYEGGLARAAVPRKYYYA